MVNEATIIEDDKAVTEEEVETEAVETETDDDDQPGEGETEVVFDGGDSQPKKAASNNAGIRTRINKLNKKHGSEMSEAQIALQLERDKNIILQARVDQADHAIKQTAPPNPENFTEGIYDEGFKKAEQEYTDKKMEQLVEKTVADRTKQSAQSDSRETLLRDLEKSQVSHYQRAAELGVKDYDETEDKAIEILGEANVNAIIRDFDKSHIINYYLGKNPDKAAEIGLLAQTSPGKAYAAIGRLEERLKVKSKTNPASTPDEELVGGAPTAQGQVFAKHKRLLEKACSGKQADMTKLAKFRKDMRAKGITL